MVRIVRNDERNCALPPSSFHLCFLLVRSILTMSVQQYFLPPNQASLPSIADHLLNLGTELKDCLVIVPTAQSARQLRQHLPQHAGKAILAPAVTTADIFFSSKSDSQAADQIQWWSAWSEVLRELPAESLEDLFPVLDGITRDFHWGLKAAQRFCKLKEAISSVDHSFSSVAPLSEESHRWHALAKIDKQVREQLFKLRLRCPADTQRHAAKHWQAPAGVKRIVLANVVDLPKLAQIALSQCQLPIDILIHASEPMQQHFSPWGIPDPEYWAHCPIPLPAEPAQSIQIDSCAHSSAETLIQHMAGHQAADTALAVTDTELSALVIDSVTRAGWPCFDPDGRSVKKSGLWSFLNTLKQSLGTSAPFHLVQSILKAPEARYLLKSLKHPAIVAAKTDRLFQRFLPQNFSHAIACADAELRPVLEELHSWLTDNSAPAFRFLEQLFDQLERSPAFPDELIEPFLEATNAIKNLENGDRKLSHAQAIELVMSHCENVKSYGDRTGTVIDQIGWLELPFCHQAHVHIVGFHESCVPERPHDDGFLPASLRKKIQLYSRDQMNARDAFLLHSLIESRKNSGSVTFFTSQSIPSGEERQVSRLLLRCPDAMLPSRVQYCFQETNDKKANLPAYSTGNWQLNLQNDRQWPEHKELTISPSRLAKFLQCPFRFYLQYVEGFYREHFDYHELNAMQFGNLVHDVLELYGKDPQFRNLDKEADIKAVFQQLLDKLFERRYGKAPNLPLSIQKESAHNRLQSFASHQAAMRAEGWEILHVELSIGSKEEDIHWQFEQSPVAMRIDRIDVNRHTGAWRVIDYKTSTKTKLPASEHLESLRSTELPDHQYGELADPEIGKRNQRRWKNLQLPLYAEFVRQHFGLEALPEVAYVAFPAATSNTGLQVWDEYSDSIHDCAMEWTRNIIQAIHLNQFPARSLPSNMLARDDFAALSPEGPEHAFIHS